LTADQASPASLLPAHPDDDDQLRSREEWYTHAKMSALRSRLLIVAEQSNAGDAEPGQARVDRPQSDSVQCPNCCRLAPVTTRSMGLLFYKCELCETVGAAPDPNHPAE
jgi:hypothetical protein